MGKYSLEMLKGYLTEKSKGYFFPVWAMSRTYEASGGQCAWKLGFSSVRTGTKNPYNVMLYIKMACARKTSGKKKSKWVSRRNLLKCFEVGTATQPQTQLGRGRVDVSSLDNCYVRFHKESCK